jgi:predicted transcriptional regulator
MRSRHHRDVRTTLTLDDDVARLIEEEVRRSGDSFKNTVNSLLRKGLVARRHPQPRKRFIVTPVALNTGLGSRYEKAEDLMEAMEGPMHR